MGWKTSLIIIENPDGVKDEFKILEAIGKEKYRFEKKILFKDCLYPKDKSISIGYYNGNIIISDDYQITNQILENANGLYLTKEEKLLCGLFPRSEIVTIACHSVVNYHGYSLIQNSEKKRLKTISTDASLVEFGQRTTEETKVYDLSYQRDGKNFWTDKSDPNIEYSEDQLMEDFVFGIAQRRLGVYIDQSEGDELRETVSFNKYIRPNIFSRVLSYLKP